MANTYDDSVVDTKVANLQTQINMKAASTELSENSSVHSTSILGNTNRIAALESKVAQLEQLVAQLSYQVSQLS